jgi:hypothetical protein
MVVDGVNAEKHMPYQMLWEAMKKEEGKGADFVSFKCWEKGGLSVLKSCYGAHIVGLLFTLDCALVTNPKAKCETSQDELDNGIAFPMVDVRKLTTEDRCSSKQKHNPKVGSIVHGRIVDALKTFEKDRLRMVGNWQIGRGRRKRSSISVRSAVQCLMITTMITEICFTLSRSPRTVAQEKSAHAGGIASRVTMRPLE